MRTTSRLLFSFLLCCFALPLLCGCSCEDAKIRKGYAELDRKWEAQEKERIEQLRDAADQGDAEAQYKLANHYSRRFYKYGSDRNVIVGFTNDGRNRDEEEALKWYRKAAEQGHVWAQYSLGKIGGILNNFLRDRGNPTEALEWLKEAARVAEQGRKFVLFEIAECYYRGLGASQDKEEAANWYRKAAELGHVGAQFTLGKLYFEGEGIPQDKAEAVAWWRKAAEQGSGWDSSEAQYWLGKCYFDGEGVPQDKTEAVAWWSKADRHHRAIPRLAQCYFDGDGVPQDTAKAIAILRSEHRKLLCPVSTHRTHILAENYFYGHGVVQDKTKALELFLQAAGEGHEGSRQMLLRLRP